jgi:hypothetical protein
VGRVGKRTRNQNNEKRPATIIFETVVFPPLLSIIRHIYVCIIPISAFFFFLLLLDLLGIYGPKDDDRPGKTDLIGMVLASEACGLRGIYFRNVAYVLYAMGRIGAWMGLQ